MYIATTILHISSTEVRPKAKLNQNQTSQQNLLPKKKKQEPSEAKQTNKNTKARCQKPSGHACGRC